MDSIYAFLEIPKYMKALKLFIIGVLCFIVPTIAVFAVSWTDDPIKVVDEVSDKDWVQKTYVNDVWGDTVFTVLDSLKVMSVPYIQWMVYIGLWLAMFAIMYNGIILLMNLWDKSKVGVVKKDLSV